MERIERKMMVAEEDPREMKMGKLRPMNLKVSRCPLSSNAMCPRMNETNETRLMLDG